VSVCMCLLCFSRTHTPSLSLSLWKIVVLTLLVGFTLVFMCGVICRKEQLALLTEITKKTGVFCDPCYVYVIGFPSPTQFLFLFLSLSLSSSLSLHLSSARVSVHKVHTGMSTHSRTHLYLHTHSLSPCLSLPLQL
jgi:hypothetical protein